VPRRLRRRPPPWRRHAAVPAALRHRAVPATRRAQAAGEEDAEFVVQYSEFNILCFQFQRLVYTISTF